MTDQGSLSRPLGPRLERAWTAFVETERDLGAAAARIGVRVRTMEKYLDEVRREFGLASRNDLVGLWHRRQTLSQNSEGYPFVEEWVRSDQELIDTHTWHSTVTRCITARGEDPIESVPHYNREPLTSATTFTRFELFNGRLIDSASPSLAIRVTHLLVPAEAPNAAEITVHFMPGLRSGDSATYSYEEIFSGPPVTPEDVRAAANRGRPEGRTAVVVKRWRTVRVTRLISRSFTLPPNMPPHAPRLRVYVEENYLAADEMMRLRSALSVRRLSNGKWNMAFDVENPKRGHIYSLEWSPEVLDSSALH